MRDAPEGATVKKIAESIYEDEESVRAKINIAKQKGEVKLMGRNPEDKRWNLFKIADKDGRAMELLKGLKEIMETKMKFKDDAILSDENLNLLEEVEELV